MSTHSLVLGVMTALCVALALSTPGWNGADLVASIAIFMTWIWWCRKHRQIHG